jgi:WD40-like Beta Propeller Repeat
VKRLCIAAALAAIVLVLTAALAPTEKTSIVRAFAGGQAGLGSPVSTQASPSSPPAVTEELIAEKDPAAPVDDEEDIVSFDGRKAAWRTVGEKKWSVMLNGQRQGGEFDEVRSLTFSDDGQRLAFAARRNKSWFVVLDAKESAQAFEKVSSPLFGPDGLHLVYFGKRQGKWSVILDEEQLEALFDDFMDAVFSPDGNRLACVGRRGDKWVVVVDLKAGPPFDVIGGLRFSAGGQRFSYAGADVKTGFGGDKGLGRVVVDGEPGPQFEGEKAGMFIEKTEQPSLIPGYFGDLSIKRHGVGAPVFSTDASHVAYAAHQAKEKEVVVVDGEPGPQFAAIIAGPRFSPDGKRIAYAARRGKDDAIVVVDGQLGPRFASIVAGPQFCTQGRHVAYVAAESSGGRFLMVDGERVGGALLSGADFVSDLTFAPDGRRVGFVAISGSFWAAWARNMAAGANLGGTKAIGRTAKRRVYIDGQPGAEYDTREVSALQFSPDSRHAVYIIHGLQEGSRRVSFVVTNRIEAKHYDAVWARTLTIQDAGTVAYVAQSGRRFVRVTHSMR